MNIVEATKSYEAWLRQQISIVAQDIEYKHQQMALGPFPFLRATYYRWAQLLQEHCPELVGTTQVLGVGDLHLENFGTWRDEEGRLIWGINDFDEAYMQSWMADLIRLAASAMIASKELHIAVNRRDLCKHILRGYRQGLRDGGCPFVLAENHNWLRELAQHRLKDPRKFWDKLEANRALTEEQKLEHMGVIGMFTVPVYGKSLKIFHRVAGLGSLGRQRWVAICENVGGRTAREIKATAQSGLAWVRRDQTTFWQPILLDTAIRVKDPMLMFLDDNKWIERRLSPDCSRIELAGLPDKRDEDKLLVAMGYEISNVHLGTKRIRDAIINEIDTLPKDWLYRLAKRMVKLTLHDWFEWRDAQAVG